MSTLSINTTFNITLDFELAPMHKRLGAFIFDVFVQVVYVWLCVKLFFTNKEANIFNDDTNTAFALIVVYLPVLLYHLLSELIGNGQSLGKRLTGIRIVSLNGQPASNWQLTIRWLLRFTEMATTSYLPCIISVSVSKYSQRIGDLAAGTVCVQDKLPYNIQDTIFTLIDDQTYVVQYPQVMKLSDRDINTINTVIKQYAINKDIKYIEATANKVQEVLTIQHQLHPLDFLQTLIKDYNYLSQQ
jgi:uncharacterized RDD family membrane protein YckC